jgi:hypothetical protein
VKRTGTILPFAAPFGSLGRPILAFFCAKVPSLLHDRGFYDILSRFNGMKVQHCNMPNRFVWVIGFMRPCVNPVRRRMARKAATIAVCFSGMSTFAMSLNVLRK